MTNEQGAIMSVVGNQLSTELLHNVAENVSKNRTKQTKKVNNRKEPETMEIYSASDDILTTTAGDLKRLESMSVTEQSMQLDRLFEDHENNDQQQGVEEDVVNSLTRLLSFPSSFDPKRSFGAVLSDDASVTHYLRGISSSQGSSSTTTAQQRDMLMSDADSTRDISTIDMQQQHGRRPLVVCEDALLLNPRTSHYPQARRNLIMTNRPIPQHLSTHYFEMHFSGLTIPPMYVDACGAPVGKNASHDTFMVGFWIGGTLEHDERNRTLPADGPGCLWFHPKSGQVFRSGTLIHTFPKCDGNTSWSTPWKDHDGVSYVVGLLWDIDTGDVSFVRGSPSGVKGVECIGTLKGLMIPSGGNIISSSQIKKNNKMQQRQPLNGLAFPALRTSGMTGVRCRYVTGVPIVTDDHIIENQFIWTKGERDRCTIRVSETATSLEERIQRWDHAYSAYGNVRVENCLPSADIIAAEKEKKDKEKNEDKSVITPPPTPEKVSKQRSPSVQGVDQEKSDNEKDNDDNDRKDTDMNSGDNDVVMEETPGLSIAVIHSIL
jgi:hypothetical protein